MAIVKSGFSRTLYDGLRKAYDDSYKDTSFGLAPVKEEGMTIGSSVPAGLLPYSGGYAIRTTPTLIEKPASTLSDTVLAILKGNMLAAMVEGKSDEEIAKVYASMFKTIKSTIEQEYKTK